jgi:aryl-alcohol dehydrogenase-like predicted oxidoreductase
MEALPRALAMRDRLPRLTDRISLGDGLEVSPVCLGRIPDEELAGSVDTACHAFDAGVNFFFVTGDLHWRLYALARRALAKLLRRRGVRDQIVIAAVSYTRGLEEAAVGDLLSELPGLGRIDVLVGGGYYAVDSPRIGALAAAAQRAGARAVGATFHDRAAARAALARHRVDLAYVRYNPQHPGARADLFPARRGRNTRLYAFKTSWGAARDIPERYRFALSRPELDGILVKLRTPAEVDALAAVLARPPMTEAEQRRMISRQK